jgi:ADP-ribosylglycohydrolase
VASIEEQLAGGVWGLLVGDALGVPYEFHSPEDIPPAAEIEMQPPGSFRRSYPGIKPRAPPLLPPGYLAA